MVDAKAEGVTTGLDRRGFGLVAAAAGMAVAARPAASQTLSDMDIMNFALNFEYLGAEFYLRALTGRGLDPSDTGGVGTLGSVSGGSQVPWRSEAIRSYCQRFAVDELAHVRFLRAVLGSNAVAEPAINLSSSWTTLAIAAGLIVPGQTFNPFADDISFLLGAYTLEDVCVTALAGSARVLTNKDNVEAAAGLLGVEGMQAGAIRTLLANIGAGQATNAISALRTKLSGAQDDQGTSIPGLAFNAVSADTASLAFRRTPQQVLNIAYGGGPTPTTGFFPNRVNGTIN